MALYTTIWVYPTVTREIFHMTDKLVLSIPEAASRLGIGRNTAYEAVRRGEIPSVRIGGRILVPISALEQLLEGAVRTPGATPNTHDGS